MLLGRTRSGKGTIDKVLAALVGEGNHTGLAGSDLAADFGLEQLVTKTVATFSDDRMSMNGKRFVERMLQITGEDKVTVAQKNRKRLGRSVRDAAAVHEQRAPYAAGCLGRHRRAAGGDLPAGLVPGAGGPRADRQARTPSRPGSSTGLWTAWTG